MAEDDPPAGLVERPDRGDIGKAGRGQHPSGADFVTAEGSGRLGAIQGRDR